MAEKEMRLFLGRSNWLLLTSVELLAAGVELAKLSSHRFPLLDFVMVAVVINNYASCHRKWKGRWTGVLLFGRSKKNLMEFRMSIPAEECKRLCKKENE